VDVRREISWRARVVDAAMRPLDGARGALVSRAKGRVLEVGAGTGLNLAHLDDDVTLACVEPDPVLAAALVARAVGRARPVFVAKASAHALPFDDGVFDAVLFSFALCTIRDPRRALSEAARVLARDGQLLVVEHVRSSGVVERATQRALTPLWRMVSAGCHLDRATRDLVVECGFVVDETVRTDVARLPLFPVDAFVARRA